MENQNRSVKQDFIAPSPTLAGWANQNRSKLIVALSTVVAVLVVLAISAGIYNGRSESALEKFGSAMHTYETPVVAAGQPSAPGEKTFPTVADRARVANAEFSAIADKYGMTPAGRNAKYMAAISASEMGQTATAEAQLKDLASSWNSDVAALAKLALAHLYQQSGRDADAIAIYDQLTKKPTQSVPAGLAQLQLASLYEAQNKPAEAKKIYAQLKDKDAKSVAGEVAAQKLSGQDVQ